jgi:DNA repair protein RadC
LISLPSQNHASGDPSLSHADIQMKQAIIEVAHPLSISVYDHINVGQEGHARAESIQLDPYPAWVK